MTIWLGLFAPAGTPEPIVTALRSEVQKMLGQPELADKLNVTGALQPLLESPQGFAALIKSDYAKYGKLARDIGIKVE
jgi:tripartite-type tricarboxylate transporter receptor subunit TctC